MTPLAYAKLAGSLLLVGAGAAGVLSYRHLAAKAATADARIAAAEARAAEQQRTLDTLNEEIVRRAEFDREIRSLRQQTNQRLDHATATDPVARDYLGERIPDSVRNAVLVPEVR